MSNSSGRYKQRLIFCGGEPAPTTLNEIDIRLETRDAAIALKQEEESQILQPSQDAPAPKKQRSNRPSAYVTVFESAPQDYAERLMQELTGNLYRKA